MKIRVRFCRNVMGYRVGDVTWVEATQKVDALVDSGMLIWLDRPSESDPIIVDPEPDVHEIVVEDTFDDTPRFDWPPRDVFVLNRPVETDS